LDQLPALIEEIKVSDYRTIAVDTASALSDLYLAQILGLAKLPEQKSWGMADRQQYAQQGLQLKTFLRMLLDLQQNIVITAHERNFNDEGGSDLIFPTVGSALSPSVAGWLNGAVDYVCQTFIREGFTTQTMTVGKEKIETQTKTGKAEYCLRIGPHPVYQTGFRLPPGYELPDVIVNPTFDKINKIIQGGK
jgi:hypothetical protein